MPISKSTPELFMLASTYLVFISANHSSYSIKERRAANQRLVSDITLQGHYYKPVQGVYKGKPEQSYMVRCDDAFDLLQLQALAHKYHQECIMIVDKIANRVLLNCGDDVTTIIGSEIVEVTSTEAMSHDAYSIIYDEYWMVGS